MNQLDRDPGIAPAAAPVAPPPTARIGPFHHGLLGRLRTYFLTGLILVAPAYITISLTWWFINWVDDLVRPFIPIAYRPETYLPVKIPGTGLIIAFITLTLFGFLTANFVGRKLVEVGENILNRMPVIRPIYNSLKQIFQTLFGKGGSSFRRVGLIEFPSPGMWSLVFLSNPASPEIAARLPDTEHVAAFMPCTPNPTTGFFFYVARRDIIDLEITVEAAMTLLMSAGMVQPGDQQRKLAALAEAARTARGAQANRAAAPAK
ncbi:MAG TPA: DUF502 domain-containing protein [Xanthobacteraceae bacterium]|jgi:uncharacterized membrane protein|nr:DUF502 domain-containing protein [Xanthobacteraceae bacterium]